MLRFFLCLLTFRRLLCPLHSRQMTDSNERGTQSSLGRGFTCAWLTTAAQLAPSPAPAAPRLPAALMETQPEPLASAAPAATGPAQATAATPLTTAPATPPIRNSSAHWAAQLLLYEPRELPAPGGQPIGWRSCSSGRRRNLRRRAPPLLPLWPEFSPRPFGSTFEINFTQDIPGGGESFANGVFFSQLPCYLKKKLHLSYLFLYIIFQLEKEKPRLQ
ncbi:unnamed protein product [Nyctereutes procyonoides]|uniref:(raccoon dog) hypothetical protein n=1 Tax=Nyctereutes procyonoides TaxID=34880 RepID=A0A811YFU4_NYCPR|nr:unnamed protein product [Nyctereutes procyonoides]